MKLRMIGLTALLLSSTATAGEVEMEKYRDWLPGQIQAMPKKQRESEVPMAYIIAANSASSPGGGLVIQSYLNTLMYNGLSDYDGAKRLFQRDLGDPPTGNLTVGQIHTLAFRAEHTRLTQVNFFPFKFGGHQYADQASVRGTAKLLDDEIAYPVNYVEIECRRAEGTCNYRQFVLVLPDESSWAQSYSVNQSMDETYRITRWEDGRIDAAPMEENGCRINELRLNFAAKEFYEIVTNAPEGECELVTGGSFPRLERPRIAQIVDGDPVIEKEFQQISRENYRFLSSEFRARVDALAAGK